MTTRRFTLPKLRVYSSCLLRRFFVCRKLHRSLALIASVVFSTFLLLSISKESDDPLFDPSSRKTDQQTDRVFIWQPGGECTGHFVSEPAKHGQNGVPYAIVREAIIDRRLTANNHFLETHPQFKKLRIPFVRVVIFMTMHMSVRGEMSNANATVVHAEDIPNTINSTRQPTTANVLARVDYFQQVDGHLNRGSLKAYRPGMINQKGISLTEWQVSISLFPSQDDDMTEKSARITTTQQFMSHLIELSRDGTWALHVDLQLRRFDDHVMWFRPRMKLACATGWFFPEVMPQQLYRPACPSATGAVLFSGSALHGKKNSDASNYHEVGHFAARALHGPVEFDTVAVSVIPPFAVSHDRFQRHRDDIHYNNQSSTLAHLERIRAAVEYELTELGVGFNGRSKIILAPVCRLGSYGEEGNYGRPCSKSFWNGQYTTLLVLYSMLSPSFQWAASLDLDEVLLGRPTKTGVSHYSTTGRADRLFNGIAMYSRNRYFTSGWINFRSSAAMARNLSMIIMKKRLPQLTSLKKGDPSSHLCFIRRTTGKPAVRCDVGVGFTIHQVIVRNLSDKTATLPHLSTTIVSKRNPRLMTWHPRLQPYSTNICGFIQP